MKFCLKSDQWYVNGKIHHTMVTRGLLENSLVYKTRVAPDRVSTLAWEFPRFLQIHRLSSTEAEVLCDDVHLGHKVGKVLFGLLVESRGNTPVFLLEGDISKQAVGIVESIPIEAFGYMLIVIVSPEYTLWILAGINPNQKPISGTKHASITSQEVHGIFRGKVTHRRA